MAGTRPSILVVDGDWEERVVIASVLREAGFAVVAVAQCRGARAALKRERFAASVIALPVGMGPDGVEIEFVGQTRRCQPGLKSLVVSSPAAMQFVDEDCATLLTRPFDPRQLLGCVFELVLREGEPGTPPTAPLHRHAAELGINAARLACLYNRHATAAAAGASRLAHDLTRQIGETRALHRGLAAALSAGGGAADALARAG